MTYLEFHLVFILPVIALLWLGLRGRRHRLPARAWGSLLALVAIAFVYTTPWDNYLVYRGVWGYGSDRVIGTIGYVPIEEYLFFIVQPILTGLFLYNLLARQTDGRKRGSSVAARWAGTALWLAVAVAGAAMLLRTTAGVYLGLILAWAAPVLAGQWAFAGSELWARRTLLLPAVAAPTLYLWFADWIAIRLGIWEISTTYTTGLMLDTLPIEEAVFFMVTNILVVQGILLFLYPPARPGAMRRGGGREAGRPLDRSGAA
jgi:lycopene beta-cyclase